MRIREREFRIKVRKSKELIKKIQDTTRWSFMTNIIA